MKVSAAVPSKLTCPKCGQAGVILRLVVVPGEWFDQHICWRCARRLLLERRRILASRKSWQL